MRGKGGKCLHRNLGPRGDRHMHRSVAGRPGCRWQAGRGQRLPGAGASLSPRGPRVIFHGVPPPELPVPRTCQPNHRCSTLQTSSPTAPLPNFSCVPATLAFFSLNFWTIPTLPWWSTHRNSGPPSNSTFWDNPNNFIVFFPPNFHV